MSNEMPGFILPLKELEIDIDDETGKIVMALSTGLQSAAAEVPPEALQRFIMKALLLAGHLGPARPTTTHTDVSSFASIQVQGIGISDGRTPETLNLLIPVGHLTMAFEMQKWRLVQILERYLSSGVQGPEKPAPN